jgi:hypothetical protein
MRAAVGSVHDCASKTDRDSVVLMKCEIGEAEHRRRPYGGCGGTADSDAQQRTAFA